MVMRTINNIKNNNWAGVATDVATLGASFIPGVGPIASAAISAGIQSGGTVAQGGGVGDAIKSGVSSLIGAGLGAVASKLAKTGDTKTPTPDTGTSTGGAAPVPTTNTNLSLSQKIDAKAPVPSGAPELRPAAQLTKAQTLGAKVIKGGKTVSNSKAGKIAGQFGVQGVLSVSSAIMGAKQANAANEISKQSLLFQKQTYNEQQAEIEKNKAQRKADALTDYNAASLFGSQLYGSDSNSTLLTNYHTNNGTGNQGSFSLLNASITTSKRTDLT